MQHPLKRYSILFLFIIVNAYTTSTVVGQNVKQAFAKNWQLLDYRQDSVYGTSTNKAYAELLKGKKSYPVIVAVIDNGVDTAQEDLKGHIWTNTKEIPGNGIDDDHNGYIDDVHGWNFLGGKDGRTVINESEEAQRETYRLDKKFAAITDSSQVNPADKNDYHEWVKLSAKKGGDLNSSLMTLILKGNIKSLKDADSLLKKVANKDTLYAKDIKEINTTDPVVIRAQEKALTLMRNLNVTASLEDFIKGMEEGSATDTSADVDPNKVRLDIVKDNPDDITDIHYGNNDVTDNRIDRMMGLHGTHVAGIIAANRDNNIGIDGVANNVLIMPIKVVPDGDERDKDVALSIRYAVDNGAQIINMSFGKAFSPHKVWVDDAVKYAEKKGVLLIDAAGNENNNNDSLAHFPNADYIGFNHKASNFIVVGASGSNDGDLAAGFSNYGKKDVDVFAPGVDIYSTIPGNQYQAESGTSMASPVVAGVAALVLSYYPTLSAVQLKYVLEHSVMSVGDHEVTIPGNKGKIDFGGLSKTGGIVNAYNALKLAATIKGKRKISGK